MAQHKIVLVIGTGAAAEAIGIRAKPETVAVRQIVDARAPKMQIILGAARSCSFG